MTEIQGTGFKLNILIAILVIVIYRLAIEPGHPGEFYDAAALKIAPWCSHTAGSALFLLSGYFLTRRRPERHGYLFATAFTVFYAIIDSAMVGFASLVSIEFGLSLLAKLLAALAGAFLATRQKSPAVAPAAVTP